MATTSKTRFADYIRTLRLSKREVEDKLGWAQSALSQPGEFLTAKLIEIKREFPSLNLNWIITGEGEMTENTRSQIAETPKAICHTGVPYYDFEVFAGYSEDAQLPTSCPECYISIPQYKGADCACPVYGQSMYPEIKNGDVVILKRISDLSVVIYGDVYTIETVNGLNTIKRIMKGDAPDTIKLVAANPEYEAQDIPKNSIRRIYRVMGIMRRL